VTQYGYSHWAGRVRRPTTIDTADAPVDAVSARDHASNANHYGDIFGQVRARWVSQAGSYIESVNTNSKTWRQMWYCPTFPIALLPDGSSYRLRVRVAGAAENAGFEVRFAVTVSSPVGPLVSASYPGTIATDAGWRTGSITATAPAWLSGNSLGTNAWTAMIAMTGPEASACARSVATVLDTNGVPISVTQALPQVVVWGYDEDVAHHARLYGVDVEEWPG